MPHLFTATFSPLAALRILSSPFNAFPWLCVQVADLLARIPLGPRPSLRHLRSLLSHSLFGALTGTTPVSDFSVASISVFWPLAFTDRPAKLLSGTTEISRFSCIQCPRMLSVFDSAGPGYDSLSIAVYCVAFPFVVQGRHPKVVISELNGWPIRFPLSTLRALPHGNSRMTRGHDGSAIPFMWGSFIPCYMPVYPGAHNVPIRLRTKLSAG